MRKPDPAFTIPPEIAARYTEPDQFERFDAAVSKVLSVPRAEILRREAEYKRRAALNPNPRGPKPKGKAPAATASLRTIPTE